MLPQKLRESRERLTVLPLTQFLVRKCPNNNEFSGPVDNLFLPSSILWNTNKPFQVATNSDSSIGKMKCENDWSARYTKNVQWFWRMSWSILCHSLSFRLFVQQYFNFRKNLLRHEKYESILQLIALHIIPFLHSSRINSLWQTKMCYNMATYRRGSNFIKWITID